MPQIVAEDRRAHTVRSAFSQYLSMRPEISYSRSASRNRSVTELATRLLSGHQFDDYRHRKRSEDTTCGAVEIRANAGTPAEQIPGPTGGNPDQRVDDPADGLHDQAQHDELQDDRT